MKGMFLIFAASSAIASAGVLSANPTPAPATPASVPAKPATEIGSATAEVLHLLTGRPVPGMPVHVVLIMPEGAGEPQVFVTGRDGRALLSPLEDGSYEVYVEYNNHRSRSAFFVIDGMIDLHPFVTLRFNPDIDSR